MILLTLRAPDSYNLNSFNTQYDLFSATNSNRTTVSLYSDDAGSYMLIKGKTWTLGSGYKLGAGLYLDDSPVGVNEGAYRNYVCNNNSIYVITFSYKTILGGLIIRIVDSKSRVLLNDTIMSSNWYSYEATFNTGEDSDNFNIYFLQTETHSSPYIIDDLSVNPNYLLTNPDSYRRILERGSTIHTTISGKRIQDFFTNQYTFKLSWNFFDKEHYDNLVKLFNSGEILYLDDGEVPRVITRRYIHNKDIYNYYNITKPSSTNVAYYSISNNLPSSKSDFETNEFTTEMYTFIGSDDDNYAQTISSNTGYYCYNKFVFKLSDINVQQLSFRIKYSCSDSSSAGLNGVMLYVWDGISWKSIFTDLMCDVKDHVIVFNHPLTSSIIDQEGKVYFVIRSMSSNHGASVDLKIYYLLLETNVSFYNIVDLDHRAVLDRNNDVIYVKNLTTNSILDIGVDYNISADRRSVNVINQPSGSLIEVCYDRYFEVFIEELPDSWHIESDIRSCDLTLRSFNG